MDLPNIILNPATAVTALNNLTSGTYQFELKASNSIGEVGKDTVDVLATYGTLSVIQTEFFAKPVNDKVLLAWKTTPQTNNSYFLIERSYNGKLFKEIGRVNAVAKYSAENGYLFSDKQPAGGINYYRLKIIDQNGMTTYSKVVSAVIIAVKNNANFNIGKVLLSAGNRNIKIIIYSNQQQIVNAVICRC